MNCPQCGASLQMLERDFYVRCPYCGARIPWSISGRDVRVTRPVLDEPAAARLFPGGSLESLRLRYFPYSLDGSRLVPAFNQPVSELEGYTPPAGDTIQFDPALIEPDTMIPPGGCDPAIPLVFHPVWVAIPKSGDAASYVDAVGGNPIGRRVTGRVESDRPVALFTRALAAGLAGSVPLYAAGVSIGGNPADLFGVALAGSIAGIAIFRIFTRRRRL